MVEYSPKMNTNHISSTQHASFSRSMPCTRILHTNITEYCKTYFIHAWYINDIAIYINMCDYIFMDANCLVINLIVLGVIVLFVETPRKFITAVINVRGVSTNKTIICFIAMQTYKELVLGVST